MRVAALWFPDWPIQAAQLDGPAAVASQHQIAVCNSAARQVGVRRGMRVRQAQELCPQLQLIDANPDHDGALFSEVADGLDAVASAVEVLRPGLVIVDAAAAGRFHGSEDVALEMLIDATATRNLNSQLGVADEIATALIAARAQEWGAVVPRGGSREFLAPQPVNVLSAEVALGCDVAVVDKLQQLGVRTLGDVADLSVGQVTTRFGQPGLRAHEIARAKPDRRVAPELARPDLAVEVEEEIDRVDAAAFGARQLAARLHQRLSAAGLSCLRLRVAAELSSGEWIERVWRTREALTERATADRVRWQLDGWLRQRREAACIIRLRLEPVEVAAPQGAGLWGGEDNAAQQVIERVQSQLGIDKVLQPRLRGGRGVAERIALVPYGEPAEAGPVWGGQIPAPLPALLGQGVADIHDATGHAVFVTAEALLSADPAWVQVRQDLQAVEAWAGPWPADEAWWSPHSNRVARLQVVGANQKAWLLAWTHGQWLVEAEYS